MKLQYTVRKLMLAIIISFCTISSGCLQKDFDYKGSPINPYIDKTVWEFLESRPDDFSLMTEAITYAGMEDLYNQSEKKYSYILINNVGMNIFLSTYGSTTAVTLDVETVKKFLQYHIIEGEYHAFNKKLPVESIFVKTLLSGEDGLLTIKVNKSSIGQATNQDQVINGNIVINETGTNGASRQMLSLTTNIMATNGPAHVFRNYSFYKRNSTYQTAY